MSDEPPWSSSRAAILAVVAGVLVLVVVPLVTRRGGDAPTTTHDDAPTLSVFVAGRALRSGDIVRPGDTVHFSVRTPVGAHATIIVVDGTGHARALVGPVTLEAGESQLPPEPGTLDDVLGDERYVAFTCVLPVAANALLAAARAERMGVDGCAFDVVTAKKLPR